jgi:phosphohistidine phosphatase
MSDEAKPAALTLVLVRHGEAAPASSDEARELTPDGRRAVRMLSAELQAKGFSPSAIRTSPARRAHQTAEILFSALPEPGPVQPTSLLAPGAAFQDMLRLLQAEQPGSTVLWVGHTPALGRLAAFLLGQPGEVQFRACSVLVLQVDLSNPIPVATREWDWAL